MSMTAIKDKQNFALTYNKASELEAGVAITEFREAAMATFIAEGFPTQRNEAWKYTSLKKFSQHTFTRPQSAGAVSAEIVADHKIAGAIALVFIDGVFEARLSDMSDLPTGLGIESLDAHLKDDAKAKRFVENSHTIKDDDVNARLNHAFTAQGSLITVEANAVIKPLIQFIHLASFASGENCQFIKHRVCIGKSAQANILETWTGDFKQAHFSSSLLELVIAENAQAGYYRLQAETGNNYHMGSSYVTLARDAQLNSFTMSTGSGLTRNDLHVAIDGSGSHATLDGMYLLKGDARVDNFTTVGHNQPNCTSSQLYKGVLDDKSGAAFTGRINVEQIAQQTNAYQLNRNMLLSPESHVDTRPQLEIHADDVKCTHGATVGQLDENEVFYFQSRGITPDQARAMLARGFAADALKNVSCEQALTCLTLAMDKYFK